MNIFDDLCVDNFYLVNTISGKNANYNFVIESIINSKYDYFSPQL